MLNYMELSYLYANISRSFNLQSFSTKTIQINRNFHMHLNKQPGNESKTHTVTSQEEILADRRQSTFSPEGACMKLASRALTFCSLTTLCKEIPPLITTAQMYSKCIYISTTHPFQISWCQLYNRQYPYHPTIQVSSCQDGYIPKDLVLMEFIIVNLLAENRTITLKYLLLVHSCDAIYQIMRICLLHFLVFLVLFHGIKSYNFRSC